MGWLLSNNHKWATTCFIHKLIHYSMGWSWSRWSSFMWATWRMPYSPHHRHKTAVGHPCPSGGRSPIDVGGDAFVLAGWGWYLGRVFHALFLRGAGVEFALVDATLRMGWSGVYKKIRWTCTHGWQMLRHRWGGVGSGLYNRIRRICTRGWYGIDGVGWGLLL